MISSYIISYDIILFTALHLLPPTPFSKACISVLGAWLLVPGAPGAWIRCLGHGFGALSMNLVPGAWIWCLGHVVPGAWIWCLRRECSAWGMDLVLGAWI